MSISSENSTLITSLVPIAVALISLVISLITTKKSNVNIKEVELLKEDIQKRRDNLQKSNHELDKQEESLANAIKCIQMFKDEISIILASSKNGTTVSDALSDIENARDCLITDYAKHGVYLCPEGEKLLHRSKDVAISTHEILQTASSRIKYINDISEEYKKKITNSRDILSDIQNILRDNRSELLSTRVKIND